MGAVSRSGYGGLYGLETIDDQHGPPWTLNNAQANLAAITYSGTLRHDGHGGGVPYQTGWPNP
jgi:hypothetical protein